MKIANYQLDELLQQVNDSADVESALSTLIKNDVYARAYIDHAVNDSFVEVDLPESAYTYSTYHRSLAGMRLCTKTSLQIFNDILINPESLHKTKRFQLKNLLEMLHSGEAKILNAIITKNLTSLYPNITHELMCKVL